LPDSGFLRVRSSDSIADEANFYQNETLVGRVDLAAGLDCAKSRIGAHG
jgi:hypothetical protein